MAFLNRVGSLLKNTVSKHVSAEVSAPSSSLFQAIRNMSSSKLFVGGLSYDTDEQSLKEAFSQYGEVVEARVIMDRESGRSRGFAFVTFTSTEAALSAIQAYDGHDLHGRKVRVNYATEKPRFGGGNYGGGGGYQGGGGSYNGGYGGGNQYPSGGGGFGGDNQYPNGGGGGFGGSGGFGRNDSFTSFGGQNSFAPPADASTGSFGDSIQSDQHEIGAENQYHDKDGNVSDEDFANRRS